MLAYGKINYDFQQLATELMLESDWEDTVWHFIRW